MTDLTPDDLAAEFAIVARDAELAWRRVGDELGTAIAVFRLIAAVLTVFGIIHLARLPWPSCSPLTP